MANATSTFTIDNTADYPVIAQTNCRRIEIRENYNSTHPPTEDLLAAMPSGAPYVRVPMGTSFIFTPAATTTFIERGYPSSDRFLGGTTVGTIKTAAGSITVAQIEYNLI